jgi:hypothetical protein
MPLLPVLEDQFNSMSNPAASFGIKQDGSATRNTPDVNKKDDKDSTRSSSKQTKKNPLYTEADPGLVNILTKYRSYTYNFTLAVLNITNANDPDTWENDCQRFTILKSAGKGKTVMQGTSQVDIQTALQKFENAATALDATMSSLAKANAIRDTANRQIKGNALLEGFNRESPGHFDMFIDNVEIKTIMTPNSQTGVTQGISISFDITEPYSINGLLEALHVAALSAGYQNYNMATYVLKVEFKGYPDNQSIPKPEVIPGTVRYFPIMITTMEIEASKKGTLYKVTATPVSQVMLGETNKFISDTSVEGKTLVEVGTDIAKKLTTQLKESRKKKLKRELKENEFDEYQVYFPVRDQTQKTGWNFDIINDIGKSDFYKEHEDNKNPTMSEESYVDAMGITAYAIPANQGNKGIQKAPGLYKSGHKIDDALTSLVRDSHYVRGLLEKPDIDADGYITYFKIITQVENKDTIDPDTRKPFLIYRYLVIPYKMHYTAIPDFNSSKVDPEKLVSKSVRSYNYMYTGKNTEVMDFRITLNNLYFEAMAKGMGDNDARQDRLTGAKNDSSEPKKKVDPNSTMSDSNGTARAQEATVNNESPAHGSSMAPQYDPYLILARNFHQALIETTSDNMLTGEIKILGDPLYVCSSAAGNYTPKMSTVDGITQTEEADYLSREIIIFIKFNNPIDINPATGKMKFSQFNGYSGAYKILTATSKFSSGAFTQSLEIMRMRGQIDLPLPVPTFDDVRGSEPNPNDIASSPPANSPIQFRAQPDETLNLSELYGRDIPNPGSPAEADNFTDATGGLGGTSLTPRQQVFGAATDGIGRQTAAAAVYGGAILGGPNQLSSGIRMSTAGLLAQSNQILGVAGAIQNASQLLSQVLSNKIGTNNARIVSSIVGSVSSAINKPSVQGSGIGVGPTVYVEKADQIDPTSIYETQGVLTVSDLNAQTAALPTDAVSYTGVATGMEDVNFSRVTPLENAASAVAATVGGMATSAAVSLAKGFGGKAIAGLIGGVGKNLAGRSYGTKIDPNAIGEQFGINTSRITGLAKDLPSKLTEQLYNLAPNIGRQVSQDIQANLRQGLIASSLNSKNIGNVPPVAPFAVAPDPSADPAYFSYPGPTDPLNTLPGRTPVDNTIMRDKISSASKQVFSITNNPTSVESQNLAATSANISADLYKSAVNQFGSASSPQSPLGNLFA